MSKKLEAIGVFSKFFAHSGTCCCTNSIFADVDGHTQYVVDHILCRHSAASLSSTDADVLTTVDSKSVVAQISSSEMKIVESSQNVSSVDAVSTSANDASVEESKDLLEKLKNQKDEMESSIVEIQVRISGHLMSFESV